MRIARVGHRSYCDAQREVPWLRLGTSNNGYCEIVRSLARAVEHCANIGSRWAREHDLDEQRLSYPDSVVAEGVRGTELVDERKWQRQHTERVEGPCRCGPVQG